MFYLCILKVTRPKGKLFSIVRTLFKVVLCLKRVRLAKQLKGGLTIRHGQTPKGCEQKAFLTYLRGVKIRSSLVPGIHLKTSFQWACVEKNKKSARPIIVSL